ncbi:MAG: biliverdin-producing heme oxygenase [Waddliaceae bacterium]
MDIIQELRKETAAQHQEIEHNSLLKRLSEDLSLEEYIRILEKFYAFYSSFESHVDWKELGRLSDGAITQEKRRTPLLEKDLTHFGVLLNKIPKFPPYARSFSFPALMGCFYVLEGSCLGRKMLYPKLSAKFDLNKNAGGAFFYDYGDKITVNWTNFRQFLKSEVKTDSEIKECTNAAIQTFENIHELFKNG